jgi:serine/threonine protein kinase
LKPENILLSSKDPKKLDIRIADLGLSTNFKPGVLL